MGNTQFINKIYVKYKQIIKNLKKHRILSMEQKGMSEYGEIIYE